VCGARARGLQGAQASLGLGRKWESKAAHLRSEGPAQALLLGVAQVDLDTVRDEVVKQLRVWGHHNLQRTPHKAQTHVSAAVWAGWAHGSGREQLQVWGCLILPHGACV